MPIVQHFYFYDPSRCYCQKKERRRQEKQIMKVKASTRILSFHKIFAVKIVSKFDYKQILYVNFWSLF